MNNLSNLLSAQPGGGNVRLKDLVSGRTEEEINRLLSGMRISTPGFNDGGGNGGGPYQQPQDNQPQAFVNNYVRNNSTGQMTNLDQRQPTPQNFVQRGNSAPIDMGQSRQSHDVWKDGPLTLNERQNPDGTITRTVKKPTYDGEGRFSSVIVDELVTPDYLNPAKLVQLKLQEARQKLQGGALDQRLKLAQFDAAKTNPQGFKLKPGERVNQQTGNVEAVPGSDLYINQSGKHAEDLDALKGAEFKTQGAIAKVNEIIGNQSGFESNFGGYNAYLTQYMPGEATDTRKKIESLKSDLKMAGLEMMRSGGSIGMMTEREWPIVEQMVASISPALSEKEAAFQLAKVKTYMENIAKKAAESYQTEWGTSQFARQGGVPQGDPTQSKPSLNDWMAKARAANPTASGAELEAYYYKKYGMH